MGQTIKGFFRLPQTVHHTLVKCIKCIDFLEQLVPEVCTLLLHNCGTKYPGTPPAKKNKMFEGTGTSPTTSGTTPGTTPGTTHLVLHTRYVHRCSIYRSSSTGEKRVEPKEDALEARMLSVIVVSSTKGNEAV